MTQIPLEDMPLTNDGDSSGTSRQEPQAEQSFLDQGPRQSLPSIRDTLAKEIAAPPRELAPGPKPELHELFVPGVHDFYLDGLPIRTYQIGDKPYNMQQPPHETSNTVDRRTVDNRIIQYHLEVKQQPEKARACGSGNKSSNDRRPVDPPPVVVLKVFINGVECTTTYDATFMVYASLEHSHARPISQGKKYIPSQPAVLAGVTVASAAYLEKPERAAYFIFPDLSVRHENWYRLRFSLFEGIKHDYDADADRPFDLSQKDTNHLTTPVRHEGVFNRMDVVSKPFQVYSAKKFPGLAQSTNLSMMVADQGCRVRIRRDVRQRKSRLNGKPEQDHDAISSYQGTPHPTYPTVDHSRSASRNSLGSQYERKESVDSFYGGSRLPSRQMSSSSYSMTSPSLPTPTSSMPPPSALLHYPTPRTPLDSIAYPAPYAPTFHSGQPSPRADQSTFPRVFAPETESRALHNRLPPLHTSNTSEVRPDPFIPRLYDLPQPAAKKRSISSQDYGQTRLKDGSRPDAQPVYQVPYGPGANDQIEVDDNPDDDIDDYEPERVSLHGPLRYVRANADPAVRPVPYQPR